MTPEREHVTFEFHVSRQVRERYGFDDAWFALTGNVVLADLAATRRLAYRMNQVRGALERPERAVHAGQLHAMGLIDEILHYVAGLYRTQVRGDAMVRALGRIEAKLGRERVDALLARFTETFPPIAVYRGQVGVDAYLAGETAGVSHRVVVLEELLLLWLANVNPAFAPFRELFDDTALAKTDYADAIRELGACFAGEPPFGPDHQSLVDMLRSPAIASPQSLWGQLDYIRTRWGYLLGEFLDRLLVTLDVIREEERAWFLRFATWAEGQSPPVSDFRWLEHEYERFSQDKDWMPRVVLMAKSTYVWLDQLSRQYDRDIVRLDRIPDEELDRLARWGVTSLWLIGLWERSTASRRIKQLCGNPDALASAYSLHDYTIAQDLGGDEAYQNLRDRAWRRGIRLASDMVPNHMGIDSRWMVEHPDWFLSLDHSPYPGYSYNGPDLSTDPRVSMRLEDHYYDRSDAAVTFQRVDRASGETRYVYHGNDGTFMPWNDTAQLDFLKAQVREGVIQTILHVARQFPIIRFDAAMTLAKRHFQRLWYPEPGTGGAIPSRAEHGLTRAAFDAALPVEFWREVVDRVAAELPDTLLLAEAFWLMEGYFVRTLGMHRVYNSAFMNMLRDEQNANYRSVIKNTLEFDPEILKRYVNFMNNPDERTAADQFGKGDKYFGVCILMATLPGLPMFGHGQVEGFTERYGMEFRRASTDESPDPWLVQRHEQQVFPLLHRRRVFAEARDFLLYDFYADGGTVNEDVFAYSNRDGDERGLVLYHNRYADTSGWIRLSAGYAVRAGGEEKGLRQRTLGDGLGLTPSPDRYCVFREQLSGLEYVRSSLELCERGFHTRLEAYRCQVFLDFREVVSDAAHPWAEVARELAGGGTPSVEAVLRDIQLRPVVAPFRELVSVEHLGELLAWSPTNGGTGLEALLEGTEERLRPLGEAIRSRTERGGDVEARSRRIRPLLVKGLERTGRLPRDPRSLDEAGQAPEREARALLVAWILVHGLGGITEAGAAESRDWLRAWTWDRVLVDTFQRLGLEWGSAVRAVDVLEVGLGHASMFRRTARARVSAARSTAPGEGAARAPRDRRDGATHGGSEPGLDPHAADALDALLADDVARRVLGVNEHEGTWWIRKESCEELLGWLITMAEVEGRADPAVDDFAREREERAARAMAARILAAAETADWRLEGLLAQMRATREPAKPASR